MYLFLDFVDFFVVNNSYILLCYENASDLYLAEISSIKN